MPTEEFESRSVAGAWLHSRPDDRPGSWRFVVTQEDGQFTLGVTLDWADFQHLGLWVNRQTREHAKLLQARRGA